MILKNILFVVIATATLSGWCATRSTTKDATASTAEPAVVEAFKTAPAELIPLLPASTRLDMLDYYNSGLDTESTNLMSGHSRITDITDRSMKINLTPASTLQIVSLPAVNREYFALISTIATPAPDSRMTIHSDDWQQTMTDRVFKAPELGEWLTEQGKKRASEIEALVPFMLVSYAYDPTAKTLTLTNNSGSFLAREVMDEIGQFLRESLVYQWNGKKFELKK